MKISTKGRYGLEAMLDLAINASQGHVTLKSISERQGISENYLEQLFMTLRKQGMVESIRGKHGGYRLAREAKDITVAQVLNALEGPLAPVDCVVEYNNTECEQVENCVTRVLWKKVMDALTGVAESITIADLVEKYNSGHKKSIEYFI
ncbi:MAG TPA: Rrf2 family transcriptional regulator [Bacillota bacterium]|nr:Rrf2 family transcriptional regulator [Bacillota bacterium]